eukprot:CAMPEP_0206379428 /NCGR_PEP_ID=MMETSP0294-20121207/11349_1 /ASSEMBLY_ACC=CAM_ASM_000327 /TAXON_ID=39354 /ORGANISM="Heterosigma akashiwo, Strain CCMP2393" /LENGTH=88 /DNA_ID=CAMNT_0053828297 /DNA_START=1775 /DNA_END=2042 /DNA_ORIENTATION=+
MKAAGFTFNAEGWLTAPIPSLGTPRPALVRGSHRLSQSRGSAPDNTRHLMLNNDQNCVVAVATTAYPCQARRSNTGQQCMQGGICAGA